MPASAFSRNPSSGHALPGSETFLAARASGASVDYFRQASREEILERLEEAPNRSARRALKHVIRRAGK